MQPCHTGEAWTTRYPSLQPGDFVHIPLGLTVVLDTTTVDLGGLWVEGDLIFDHTQPGNTVELRTAYAVVTGTLQIGCKQGSTITRFTKKTRLTLIAPEFYSGNTLFPATAGVNWPATMTTRFGGAGTPIYEAALDRGLIVAGAGELYVFGNDTRVQSWTTLADTVTVNDNLLPLTDPAWSTWKVGDEIVIASTDFEYADQWIKGLGDGRLLTAAERGGHAEGYVQGEERTVSALNPGTQSVTLSAPLDHGHWAAPVSADFSGGPVVIDMRAEVGNLTRSVVIRGEESAFSKTERGGTTHRGHVILMKEGTTVPYCEVDWAEFENLGVQGKLGRYPFHWHMLGDARHGANLDRPFLRDCSIHHCVNRFVTVHNTSYVDVERNVGWDTLGMGFFLEDADLNGVPIGDQTQFVLLRDNLGVKVGRQTSFVSGYPPAYEAIERIEPSVFWIQHPIQKVEGNHAAGAAGHGFYLLPGSLADGWTHAGNDSYFRDNVAHSNGQNGFNHQARVEWDWQSGDDPAGEGLTAWKNRRYGIWWRTHGVSLLQDCRMADNKSGFYPASGGQQDAHDGQDPPTCRLIMDGAVVFGETPNLGEPAAGNPAEQALGRSLPQTYWRFVRPEPNSTLHEHEWDTLNAFESYDGRNVVTGLKAAYFSASRSLPNPDPLVGGSASQAIGGATQTEYNSRYLEDPRNDTAGFESATGSGQGVANPVVYRSTDANSGFSMVRNTVIYDRDGTLGHGADVYVCYDDEFFEANATAAGTPVAGLNLRILPTAAADFAQFEVRTNHTNLNQKMTVTVNHHAGGTRQMKLATLPNPAGSAEYGFNAPIGLDTDPQTPREGIYTCTFGSQMPTAYELKIQFAEAEGLPTIIGVPLAAVPTGLIVNMTSILQLNQELSLADLLNSPFAHAWYYDAADAKLYLRTTTVILGPNVGLPAGPELDGTRNVIYVN